MLSIVRRGFLFHQTQHWEQVVELILPLMLKFKYRTDIFYEAYIDLTLLGFTFEPDLVDAKSIHPNYENLLQYAKLRTKEAFTKYTFGLKNLQEEQCGLYYHEILEQYKEDKNISKSKVQI